MLEGCEAPAFHWSGTMKLGIPTDVLIKSNAEKTEFRFLLTFPGRCHPVEFELSSESTMMLMRTLETLQARYKIPIPSSVWPALPNLRIVTPDD
jgi:hypothetical protein